jgi:hypothetical protein
VLIIGAILVAAGIGAPATAIMAPRWSAKMPPAAPAAPAPPPEQPQPVFSEGGTPPPIVPVDDHAPTLPDPIVTYVPPGTHEHFPAPADTYVESPPQHPTTPPTRNQDPLPAVGPSDEYELPSIAPAPTPGDQLRPPPPENYDGPDPEDR